MLMISLKELPKKQQHSHAHRLLRECLRPCSVDYTEDSTPVTKNQYGKPSLTEYPDIHYSLSHADGIAACVVSCCECGIDCEAVRPLRPNVMKRAFSEEERRLIEEAPPEQRDLLFFRLWTLKEAYVKALGIGISYPLHTAEFSFAGGRIVTPIEGCDFRQYIIHGGKYVVSVCKRLDKAIENSGNICYNV